MFLSLLFFFLCSRSFTPLSLSLSVASSFDESDFGMMNEAIDKGRDTGGSRKNSGPIVEGEVGGDDDRPVFVTPRDDLKQEVGGSLVVGEVSDFIDAQESRFGVVLEPSLETPGRISCSQIHQHRRGFDKERGMTFVHGIVDDVLGDHGFAHTLGADEDGIFPTVHEISGHKSFDDRAVDFLWPSPVEVGHRLEFLDFAVAKPPDQGATLSLE